MNKVTVTKSQMKAIKQQRDVCRIGLDNIIKGSIHGFFGGASTPLHHMSVEQIVLAWHGHAEVDREYVSFDEAMKAHDDGSLVSFHPKEGSKITESLLNRLKDGWLGGYSLKQLRKGKWSIVGELNERD